MSPETHAPHPPIRATAFVLRPAVTATMVYVGLLVVLAIWLLATADPGASDPLLGTRGLAAVSAANALLLAALVADGVRSRASGPGLRRGHLAGVALGVALLVLVQVAAVLAHRPPAGG